MINIVQMIKINVVVQQLNTTQSIELNSNQKGTFILEYLFKKLNFNSEIQQSLQSTLMINSIEVDVKRTIAELKINNNSQVKVFLSKKIKIECDHENFGKIEYDTDAFDSVKGFQNHLINNLIKINSCEIAIINSENGKQFGNESWGNQGVFKNIKVFIHIIKLQKIMHNQTIQELQIDIVQPIAKYIHQFNKEQKIEDQIISFKCQQQYINPDSKYINLNIQQDQIWETEICQAYIFKILFEQKKIQEINVQQNVEVIELIRTIRQKLNIENTIPLKLEYKVRQQILDFSNNVKQECIPTYSQLILIKGPSDNCINVILFDQNKYMGQVERVDINSKLSDLDRFLSYDKKKQSISYYLQQQLKDRNTTLKQLNLKSECIISYQINQAQISTEYIVQELHHPSINISLVTIIFENKHTKKQEQIKVQSNCSIQNCLQEVIKGEVIKDVQYYEVYHNQEKLDLKSQLDQLDIKENSKLSFYTDFVIFTAFSQGQILEMIVNQNDSISNIEQQFKKQHNINNQFVLQMVKNQNKNETLKRFLMKQQNYQFVFIMSSEIFTPEKLIELCIQFTEGFSTQVKLKQTETALAICQEIKQRYQLPRNQVLKLFVGERLVNNCETVQEIKDEINYNKNQFRGQFLSYIILFFVSTFETKVEAQLEDTLEQVIHKNEIYGDNFSFNKQILDQKQKIQNLPIENNSKITYQLNRVLLCFQNGQNKNKKTILVYVEETFEQIVKKLVGLNIINLKYQNKNLDFKSQIKSINYNPKECIIFEEQHNLHSQPNVIVQIEKIQVKVYIEDKYTIYYYNPEKQISQIKQEVHQKMQNGIDISKYALRYKGIIIDEQKLLSSFGLAMLEFNYALRNPHSQA